MEEWGVHTIKILHRRVWKHWQLKERPSFLSRVISKLLLFLQSLSSSWKWSFSLLTKHTFINLFLLFHVKIFILKNKYQLIFSLRRIWSRKKNISSIFLFIIHSCIHSLTHLAFYFLRSQKFLRREEKEVLWTIAGHWVPGYLAEGEKLAGFHSHLSTYQ